MSASPQPTQSAKRPLEEASSPSRNDQPDAKRPALDKVIKNEEEVKEPAPESNGATAIEPNGTVKRNGGKPEAKDDQGDTIVLDAPEGKHNSSTANNSNTAQTQSNQPTNTHDETAWIHIRAVISSPEAATIIGKGGENVSKIRQMSGAKCTVSDYQKGAVERILTVSGVVDAVAKAWDTPN
jgi:poly(rC)-binding protein 2/3/4